ncbi:hypothetical protein GCM10012287_53100 [Streptomyces daqingensis]|uniref:Uncharacterized protein n=1 Tax=Streptomyces daqingensis TaxID=1472640 RepID=A0ABQ2MT78_9ACTN|nr:hypothetical protein [Streptomyces daqingensis]GGO57371.1 hypothetical protein GCM10012287_53100 [Streptomyces daqingensis]
MSFDPEGVAAEGHGRLVRDEVTGEVGELMHVGEYEDLAGHPRRRRRLAFLRPEGGGLEWTTDPDHVTLLGSATSRRRDHHGGGSGDPRSEAGT